MTTQQLTAIAPEWVVANGIIRPKCPVPPFHETFNELIAWGNKYGDLSLFTGLPDGTYSAYLLKVVWEATSDAMEEWTEAPLQDYDKFSYEEWCADLKKYGIVPRIKITQKSNHS